MKFHLDLISLILLTSALSAYGNEMGNVVIEVRNKCPQTVWPALIGENNEIPMKGGFKLDSGEFKSFEVPSHWNGTIWARTYCDEYMNCLTGSCGNTVECEGREGELPYTKGNIIVNRAGLDYYFVSLVDGFNVNMAIYPESRGVKDSTDTCGTAGDCQRDIEDFCPSDLRKVIDNRLVSCTSACLEFDRPSYCCRFPFDTPKGCTAKHWIHDYPAEFKRACPKTMTYMFDRVNTPFNCSHINPSDQKPRKYIIRLC